MKRQCPDIHSLIYWKVRGESIEKKLTLWQQFLDDIWDSLSDTHMWMSVLKVVLRILVILIVSRIVRIVINRVVDNFMNPKASNRLKLRTRRVQTVGKLLKNTATYIINFIVLLLVLNEFDINLAPLLAGAGVIGLAIGFGAQSLVKDVITGFFVILEDHFSVGDVIEVGGKFKGTVEMIGLRATRIRSWTGEIYILPNGNISDVTNYSVNNALAVVDVSVAATENLDHMAEIVKSAAAKFEDTNIVGRAEFLGIQSITASDVILRLTVLCRPNTQATVSRHLNAEVKKAFEAAGNPRYYSIEAMERAGS
ncbi:mechanosensitive ion channel family protein [Cohnella rhizosphaerae]|uniref:Mechanosensitive ion channel family protein n=1 Tax=Cohnella rhizosphaerae TaxID=1457232 RepID=A0A9X4KZN3_9BACL|nr:mechanosensitive ion channel family protein [Cohnella rhizosphaerae]MDG0811029.1 mechanosensitive ion channel family protein [Cohnella rhizosphaerae]